MIILIRTIAQQDRFNLFGNKPITSKRFIYIEDIVGGSVVLQDGPPLTKKKSCFKAS